MLIPLRTDRPLRRKPVVTEALLVINLAVYLLGLIGDYSGVVSLEQLVAFGRLDPRDISPWGPITYQFLHDPGAIWHLAFNMLFLWVFGCGVEDRLGRIGYTAFYLIGGSVAGVAHVLVSDAPVIGASGSIAGISGAFLALFPRSRLKVLFFFIIIGVFELPSLWFIGLYFVIDVLRQVGSVLGHDGGGVAYMAHIAGYVYGFGVAFGLLATGVLKRGEFDVFYLLRQQRRRAAYRATVRESASGAWSSASADTSKRLQRATAQQEPETTSETERQRLRLKADISRNLRDHDLTAAAAAHRRLLQTHPDTVMPEREQLDIANQLLTEGDAAAAAAAYETFLRHYGGSADAGEVTLMLAMLKARQLGQPDQALELVRRARTLVRETDHVELADQLLSELER